MPILKGKETVLSKALSEAEKQMGVDLKINKDGDLELDNRSDFKLIAGVKNAAQAVYLRLTIEPGGLLYHPQIGTNLQIGEKTKDAFTIKTQILASLLSDPRFENVETSVRIEGDVVFVDLFVKLLRTDLTVPFQFNVAA